MISNLNYHVAALASETAAQLEGLGLYLLELIGG